MQILIFPWLGTQLLSYSRPCSFSGLHLIDLTGTRKTISICNKDETIHFFMFDTMSHLSSSIWSLPYSPTAAWKWERASASCPAARSFFPISRWFSTPPSFPPLTPEIHMRCKLRTVWDVSFYTTQEYTIQYSRSTLKVAHYSIH